MFLKLFALEFLKVAFPVSFSKPSSIILLFWFYFILKSKGTVEVFTTEVYLGSSLQLFFYFISSFSDVGPKSNKITSRRCLTPSWLPIPILDHLPTTGGKAESLGCATTNSMAHYLPHYLAKLASYVGLL